MTTAPTQSFGHLLWQYRARYTPRAAVDYAAGATAGLTQEALSERSGVSVNTISLLERGEHRGPRRSTVELLADALDLAAADRDAFFDAFAAARGLDRRSDVHPRERGPASAVDACPYRGLQAFDEEHAAFFFGRDEDVARLLEKLEGGGFLAVLGPSGSGKSSLVRAGLLPALRGDALAGSAAWTIRVLTPGAHPLTTLAAHLRQLFPQEPVETTLDALLRDERALRLAVARALAGRPADEQAVWVVDQFEETFTLCQDENERRQFIANLLDAATVPASRCRVVLALRADFYARCAAYPELARRLSARQYLVSPLHERGLRQAIEEPAEQVGLRFKEGLVDTILTDVAHQPNALPLLEHALFELWQGRRGRMLTLEAYRANGNVAGAVAARAEAVYHSFTPSQQGAARHLLLRLTQPGEDTEDTRRRAPLSELATATIDSADVAAVVRALVDARLLTTGRDGDSDGDRDGASDGAESAVWVEVAHEALIRGWERLRGWIEDDRAGLRLHRRLTIAAREWQRLGRDEGALYRGARLAIADDWRESRRDALNSLERDFLSASTALRRREREEQEERRRRALDDARRRAEGARQQAMAARALARAEQRRVRTARRLTGALAVLLAGALLLAGIAARQRGDALSAQGQARAEQKVAFSRELAANAITQLPVDPELSVLLATRAVQTADTPQAADALRQSLAQSALRATLHATGGQVVSARFSPDGRRVLTTSYRSTTNASNADNTTEIWDARTGRGVAVLRGVGTSATFSPDGRLVATGDASGGVRLWDARTGWPAGTLKGHTAFIRDVQFSPDGRLVVTASSDATARVWDARTGRTVAVLRGHQTQVDNAQFSPDGRLIATTSDDGAMRLWDAPSGRPRAVLRVPASSLLNLAAFSPDSRYVATVNDNKARVWDARTGRAVAALSSPRSDPLGSLVDCITFMHSGHTVVTGGIDQTVRVWDALTGQNTRTLRGHTGNIGGGIGGGIDSVAVSPDDQYILSSSTDGTARVWEAPGTTLTTLRGHTGEVDDAAFSPDGDRVVTAGADGTARIWVSANMLVRTLNGQEGAVNDAAYSPNGRYIATADGRRVAQVWTTATGQRLATLRGHTDIVEGVLFSRDSRHVLTLSDDGTARLWDTPGGALKDVFGQRGGDMAAVSLSLDGRYVVAASSTGAAQAWATRTGARVATLRGVSGGGLASGVDISPDDRLVVTGNTDDTARVWELHTGRVVATLRGHTGAVNDVAFSPDGRLVATASDDATARLWDARGGRGVAVLRGHTGSVRRVVFSPDGRLLLTAGVDRTARVWQAPTGALVATLSGHTGRINGVAFSPDSRLVVTASEDQTARVWNARTGEQLAVLAGHTGAVRSAVFSPDGRDVLTAGMDGTARVFSCDVCDSTVQLLALAHTRVTRALTPQERQQYLHQS